MRYFLALLAAVMLAMGPGALPAIAQGAEIADAKVEAFSEAFLRANEVAAQWQPRVEGAGTAEEQARLAEQASGEIAAAIEATDEMSLDEYEEIIVAMRADPNLAERSDQAIRARLR
jgi:hypothetical protein